MDLATIAMHRRQEMEARINVFLDKCDRAVLDIQKLKQQAQGFIEHLNCEPSELKERFLHCMKMLDEYNYLLTDFNLALDNTSCQVNNINDMPVQDVRSQILKPLPAMNLMDALSESRPSTSRACSNQCPSEKPLRKKIPKEDKLLIAFSSSSCSCESVPNSKQTKNEREAQSQLKNEVEKLTLNDSRLPLEECNLPAQVMLQVDSVYSASIMNVDGLSFWVITEDFHDAHTLMIQMTEYYKENTVELSLDELMSLSYCAFYETESNCYYRGFFIRLTEEDMSIAEVYLVDTGETRCSSTDTIQPLLTKFCTKPPFARCCHLAGVDLMGCQNKEVVEKQEAFIKNYMGEHVRIKVDDNSSESLGVYVILSSGDTINDLLYKADLVIKSDKSSTEETTTAKALPELDDSDFDITNCPEYNDPLVAVTGYHNRDEMDICKHYKGGPDKTCFKGRRCTKRHVLKHPDGWTLDRVPVVAKIPSLPLPAPDTWHSVTVTHVAHYNNFYVHLHTENKIEQEQIFGVVLPPTTLKALVLDMNSPASRMAYKPLKMVPAPGELVAALYPPDEQWYRAKVISTSYADQNVEVLYVDYGNVVWVKEDAIRILEPRYWSLEAQAIKCILAGVSARTSEPRQWLQAREALTKMIRDRTLQAHIIARHYDEITVELFDKDGFSIAEHLAAGQYIKLDTFEVIHDKDVKQIIVVP